MNDSKRPARPVRPILTQGVLLLVLLPPSAGIAYQDQFGEPFAYLGAGLGVLLGAAVFYLQFQRWRR